MARSKCDTLLLILRKRRGGWGEGEREKNTRETRQAGKLF